MRDSDVSATLNMTPLAFVVFAVFVMFAVFVVFVVFAAFVGSRSFLWGLGKKFMKSE
jgi:hypothetical protein